MNGLGLAVFVTVSCGKVTLTVVVVPVQRAAAGQVGSPPPDAVALLVALVAVVPTFTFNVSVVLADVASVPVNVQLSAGVPVRLLFFPVAVANVIPEANVSAMIIFPFVAAVPVFLPVPV